jgi:hypothetical protein
LPDRQEPVSGRVETPPASTQPPPALRRESQETATGIVAPPPPTAGVQAELQKRIGEVAAPSPSSQPTPAPRRKSEEPVAGSGPAPVPLPPSSGSALPEGEEKIARRASPPPPAAASPFSRLAPEPRARRDAAVESARGQVESPATALSATRLTPAAPVVGRLTVKDRHAAARELTELVGRVGGAVTARRAEAGAAVVEVVVPGATYAAFAEGLGRIGAWTPDAEPSPLPARVPVTLRISE